ncbi:L(+)-tartrate dehydratase subunit alpha [Fundidesulfovibrio magnetotacticus]|uniref:L(+)-tartrate dehydratase subunit alpha n=1 Tax=Fundidesulfovibrio magnetotacticus TaxID=2730080 RepID=A0A6V8LR09_9BACT|nr:L(+)-tartrate dehydratase subunit alpha [Fundidesulfovibrio magnetotacticus]GFK93420.1 L(+)-tartrate dehydratase subunit alpha [Fundidesulfovibrio magnetotacticus]
MDKHEAQRTLTDLMARFTGYVGKRLPQDVLDRLAELRRGEDSPLARVVYDSMFENLEAADRLDRPCCQDTGVIQYFVSAGAGFPLLGRLEEILRDAVRQATREAPLRHNAVETFVEKNTGDNTGVRVPWIHWDIVPDSDEAVVEVYMAGGGCSLPGAAKVLMPSAGYEGVVRFVFDVITSYGVNACPPLLVGVGVSTSVETAAVLSKKAILRPLGTRSPKPQAAEMELLLEKGLNEVGLGPQGLSGNASVLGVHIESSARHPSTIGVGVSVGCWAHRRGTIRIAPDLSYEILSHKEAAL